MSLATPRTAALVVVVALGLSVCAQTGEPVRDNPKTTLGGILGVAGSGSIATAAEAGPADSVGGVLIGDLVGGAVGNALDQQDREMARRAALQAFEHSRTGDPSAWRNPDSGNSGRITPMRTYREPGGQYCREYEQDIVVGGETEKSYGTACRQVDGSWRIEG